MSRLTRATVQIIGATALFTLLGSCATIGNRAPDWVTEAPSDTPDTVYFVSAGSDPAGNTAQAEEQASRALVSEITKYIGVSISSETSVEAQATLDDYRAQISQTIHERSSAMLSGFRVVDRYIEKTQTGGVFIYLLGGYGREELEQEKARFAQLFAERIAALSVPEQEGDAYLKEGRLVLSAKRYLEAAAAALSSDVDNAMVRFERVAGGAREALSAVRVEPQTGFLSTTVGEPFAEPFVAVVSGTGGEPLADIPVLVTYRVSRGGGRLSVRTVSLLSDEKGEVRFDHPIPSVAGEREVVISLDLQAALEPLGAARGKARDLVDSVEDLVNRKRAIFHYRVVSVSSSLPSAILIVDYDKAGVEIGGNHTAQAIATALTAAGYIVGVVDDMSGLEESYLRTITGTARIGRVEESDGSYLVGVECAVTVSERSSGHTVYATHAEKTVRSRSAAGSVEAALTAIGEQIGKTLAAELP